ncbi:MAG: helix-turn-helix transcriptional regulator [Archangium gephyra]|uniref:Helix-turn-helix transcriptional regulator n=1 Tax=Archangium gephyra TaxID=48 RepID=A0A2W5V509_9BACT|nr:MAG: helix-turn-helix transcriptional regulator [Archangium gephyra]
MKGLPPKTLPLRVAVQGDFALVEALSNHADEMILSPVETNLEISARVTKADVLVVDTTKNPQQAFETIKNLTYERPVLALVGPGQAADALRSGAKGAIRRDSGPESLAAAIEALHAGLAVLDTSSIDVVTAPKQPVNANALQVPMSRTAENGTLTKRENEVLVLLADGLSNKEIAAKLTISEHTAKFHVNSILQKMNAQKRVEAVVRAAKLGLINI